jgi:hypothetical protein
MKALWAGTLLALANALPDWAYAQAATYKCVDETGRSTYTNVKEEMAGKKCVLVSREVSVVPAAVQAPPTPRAAPTAAAGGAARAAADRRKILEEELSDEEKRLAQAREKLAEQQNTRSGEERNYQRVLDRVKPYADAVEQHEKNVTQLRRELSLAR